MLEYDPHAWVALCRIGKLRQPLLAHGNASAFTTSSRSLPTVGRGVLTAVIAARSITSIKEPEALT
ncbi:MAG: hypothetical protein WB019_15825, partial [Pseudolabrys sp.]